MERENGYRRIRLEKLSRNDPGGIGEFRANIREIICRNMQSESSHTPGQADRYQVRLRKETRDELTTLIEMSLTDGERNAIARLTREAVFALRQSIGRMEKGWPLLGIDWQRVIFTKYRIFRKIDELRWRMESEKLLFGLLNQAIIDQTGDFFAPEEV